MQVEKFYKAQDLRKEIIELTTAHEQSFETKFFDRLNIDTKNILTEKVTDVIKKEISKIIKQKEKEFGEL